MDAIPYIEAMSDEQFAKGALTILEHHILTCIETQERCVLGLSGGSTPRPVYELLGKSESIDWTKVFLFLVDERYTDALNPESNTALVHDTILLQADIPSSQVIVPDTTLPIDDCVDLYENDLTELFLGGLPDVVLLGMGEDGHIASLFPPLPEDGYGVHLVVHTTTDRFAIHDRITVTLPVLEKAHAKIFLIRGEKKRAAWQEMIESQDGPNRWPAKAILRSGNASVVSG